MNTPTRPAAPRHVPTLTEVIDADSLQAPVEQVQALVQPLPVVPEAPHLAAQTAVDLLLDAARAPDLAPAQTLPESSSKVDDLQDAPIPRSLLLNRSAGIGTSGGTYGGAYTSTSTRLPTSALEGGPTPPPPYK